MFLENGDSVLKFPDEVVDKFQLKEGDKVELVSQKIGRISMKPLKGRFNLDNLLDGNNDENLHDDIDFEDRKVMRSGSIFPLMPNEIDIKGKEINLINCIPSFTHNFAFKSISYL